MSYILVAIGGAVGAAMRHAVNRFALAAWGPNFPYGTLIVNVAGGVAMGLVVAVWMARGGGTEGWRLFVATGVLGGFTTFLAFSLDCVQLLQRGDYQSVGIYLFGSVALSIGGLIAGMAVTRAVLA